MSISTELSTILSGFAILVAAIAWLYAYKSWDFCRDTEQVIVKLLKQGGPGMAKLSKIEIELTEHTDSIEALHESLRKLRAKVGMRINRDAQKPTDSDIPDSAKDPAGYKRAMRLKLGGHKL